MSGTTGSESLFEGARWRGRYVAHWVSVKRRDYTTHPASFKDWKRSQLLSELTRMAQKMPGGYR